MFEPTTDPDDLRIDRLEQYLAAELGYRSGAGPGGNIGRQLHELRADHRAVLHKIDGNGSPGIKSRVEVLEAIAAERENRATFWVATFAAFAAGGDAIFSCWQSLAGG